MKVVVLISEEPREHYIKKNTISFLYVHDVDSGKASGYPMNLVDSPKVEPPIFDPEENLLVSNKKLFDKVFPGLTSYDINTQHWLHHNKTLIDITRHSLYIVYENFYRGYTNWTRFIPSVKCEEVCENIVQDVLKFPEILTIDEVSRFYFEKVYPSIVTVEEAGLHVDMRAFNRTFNKEYESNFTYCYYNLHTTTGRPSNAFDSVNYSALNKKDGSRKCFTSRFGENGLLLEFDLDAYHLRLIGQIIDYTLPQESVHDYFGRKYFNTNILTPEQYQESKTISFRLLYGGLTKEYSHLEYFQKVEDFKETVWHNFNKVGYLKSPLSGKVLRKESFPDMNSSKLFNYLLQTVETEYSMIFIEELQKVLHKSTSKLVLYTYDSFLIDFNLADGRELIIQIMQVLKNSKLHIGPNYHDLKPFIIRSES